MIDLKGEIVILTGSTGFIGGYIHNSLIKETGKLPWSIFHSVADLLKYKKVLDSFKKAKEQHKTKYVIHCAGFNGGMSFNQKYPADIFYQNTVMGLNVLRAAAECEMEKVVSLVASCSYDSLISNQGPLREESFLVGYPHHSVACHGFAKRNLQLASEFYKAQYNLNAVTCLPTTVYGPNDSTDLTRTKLTMALIKKIIDSKKNNLSHVTMLGTGVARRQLIYVKDCANIIIDALKHYNDNYRPLNIATEPDISIKELVQLIKEEAEYHGQIEWDNDTAKDGQLKKELNTEKMQQLLPKRDYTPLREGIKRTIQWYTNAN